MNFIRVLSLRPRSQVQLLETIDGEKPGTTLELNVKTLTFLLINLICVGGGLIRTHVRLDYWNRNSIQHYVFLLLVDC